jgi:hypothetical protein
MTSGDSGRNAIRPSRRLRNSGLKTFSNACWSAADRPGGQFPRADVRRHQKDDLAEVGLLAVRVGQRAVVHDLQQDVEDVRVGLLDLVEQQNGVGRLADRLGQQPAPIEPDVSRGRADQPRDRVSLHVFGHVEAQERDPEDLGEAASGLGLADPGRSGQEEAADRLVAVSQSRAGDLDRADQAVDRVILPEHDLLQFGVDDPEALAVAALDPLYRDLRHPREHPLDLAGADALAARQRGRRAGLVHEVDRLVGQFAVAQVTTGEFRRRAQRRTGVPDAVMFLVA